MKFKIIIFLIKYYKFLTYFYYYITYRLMIQLILRLMIKIFLINKTPENNKSYKKIEKFKPKYFLINKINIKISY